MVLPSFFEISSGFWSTKKLIRLGLHVSPRTHWISLVLLVCTQKLDYRNIGPEIDKNKFLKANILKGNKNQKCG